MGNRSVSYSAATAIGLPCLAPFFRELGMADGADMPGPSFQRWCRAVFVHMSNQSACRVHRTRRTRTATGRAQVKLGGIVPNRRRLDVRLMAPGVLTGTGLQPHDDDWLHGGRGACVCPVAGHFKQLHFTCACGGRYIVSHSLVCRRVFDVTQDLLLCGRNLQCDRCHGELCSASTAGFLYSCAMEVPC